MAPGVVADSRIEFVSTFTSLRSTRARGVHGRKGAMGKEKGAGGSRKGANHITGDRTPGQVWLGARGQMDRPRMLGEIYPVEMETCVPITGKIIVVINTQTNPI